jgi:hypothetical protein
LQRKGFLSEVDVHVPASAFNLQFEVSVRRGHHMGTGSEQGVGKRLTLACSEQMIKVLTAMAVR